MIRGLTTLTVAGALVVLAPGGGYAQSEPRSTAGSTARPSASREPPGQPNASARQRLLGARESLAEVAKMPEAAQLQGQARTEVSQAITNFNALLTAESNWYDQYRMVMQNLRNVLGPVEAWESTAGTSGSTSGTAGSSATSGTAEEVPPALRDRLADFRQKLMAFGREAGAPDVTGGIGGSAASGTSGTSGTASPSSSTSGQQPDDPAAAGDTLEEHIDAIDDIVQEALAGGTAGTTGTTDTTPGVVTIDREKLNRIQSHLQRIREIAREKGVK